MVVSLDFLDDEDKQRIMDSWKNMSELDKAHFINQIALAMSVWGDDSRGKQLVIELLGIMTNNGATTLADFGLYINRALDLDQAAEIRDKVQRASLIVEGYRIKNALSSEPHRELF